MLRVLRLVGLIALATAVGQRPPAATQELPTAWEVPPGDRLEHETAGFAKILCSAIFITGARPQDRGG